MHRSCAMTSERGRGIPFLEVTVQIGEASTAIGQIHQDFSCSFPVFFFFTTSGRYFENNQPQKITGFLLSSFFSTDFSIIHGAISSIASRSVEAFKSSMTFE